MFSDGLSRLETSRKGLRGVPILDDRRMAPAFWTNTLVVSGWAAALLLLIAMLPPESLGSGYYEFLRLAIFVVGIYWTVYGVKFNRRPQLLVGLAGAILWNPLIPFYLGRELWFWLDLGFAALFAAFTNGVVPTIEFGAEDKRENWQ